MTGRSIVTLKDNIAMKWHLKLAHLNEAAMKNIVKEDLVDGMSALTLEEFKTTPLKCIACQEAKPKRMSFKRLQGKRSKECGARIMSDVCRVGITTPGGAKYFRLVQHEAYRFKWGFLIKSKSDAEDNLLNLLLQLENDFKIKMFLSDQGGEFKNKKLNDFFRKNGIRTLPTNAYTPEESCLVEKLNGKLMGKVRAIREAVNLPACFVGRGNTFCCSRR
ncbi:Gag-pol Polyprotein [Phytophthora megakarya]|uniref:Gag-pol Polyprotein n=1 Tax=Phytophthora megakarya TaxID=4795 RepID=A0A225VS52_9STRA|nr:Gag-pol Polyprotein [Phytophthora megakarya]